jgi:cytochrome c-type biogenesis protein CcmH
MRRTRAGSPVAWILLGLVAVSALVIGALRAGGASTPQERIDAIARTVKCPVCPGESVYESRNSVALNIKADIAREVRAGQSDDQIRAGLSARYGEVVLLVPRADGIGAAVWVLPVAVLVAAVAGLVLAFRRWRRETSAPPTDEDRALVEQALGAVPGEPVSGEPVPSDGARAGPVRSGPTGSARTGPPRKTSTDPGGSLP